MAEDALGRSLPPPTTVLDDGTAGRGELSGAEEGNGIEFESVMTVVGGVAVEVRGGMGGGGGGDSAGGVKLRPSELFLVRGIWATSSGAGGTSPKSVVLNLACTGVDEVVGRGRGVGESRLVESSKRTSKLNGVTAARNCCFNGANMSHRKLSRIECMVGEKKKKQ